MAIKTFKPERNDMSDRRVRSGTDSRELVQCARKKSKKLRLACIKMIKNKLVNANAGPTALM